MRFLAISLLVLMASGVRAEERCVATETPRQCLRRLIEARAWVDAQAQLAAANTGPSSVSTPIRSAVKDFLSLASAHVDGSSVKDSGTALILDYNLWQQANLEATLPDAVVSPAVGAVQSATTTPAPQSLGRGDDVTVTFSFSHATQHFGRSLDPHRSLFDAMLLGLVSDSGPSIAAIPTTSFDTTFVESFPDATARVSAMADFETAAIAAMPPVVDRLTTDLNRLAANQPQLYVTALYHHRKPDVGPKERGARITWEIGSDNINTFRREEGRDCESRGGCVAAMTDYATRTTKAHRSGRLSLGIEYRATSENDPTAIAPAISEIPTHSITYMATYGREITSFATGRQGRIDLALTYDGRRFSRDIVTTEQSARVRRAPNEPQFLPPSFTRFSAATTLTQPLSDSFSVPLAVVWSDREEWFPGTSTVIISPPPRDAHTVPYKTHRHQFEFHAGIRYQVPPFPRPAKCCCR